MIMVAPNGARKTKSDHPALPLTLEETVATAVSCFAAGADALHLHVRDGAGGHSIDAGLYREALAELDRAVPDMPVQITTEAADRYEVADQLDMLRRLKPRWASISLKEAARDRRLTRKLYEECAANDTLIQHIVYDSSDAEILSNWQSEGVINEDASVILVLGRYAANMNSDPDDLEPLLACLPPVGQWMLCAFGANEHRCLLKAHELGGDCRVGFENSTMSATLTPWVDNAASVRALVAEIKEDEAHVSHLSTA
ncbi:MAG: 3-keto-5-aminohexanoate cleavage protein [Boseongicola sp.]|nr:3-keto-5-aminohexanoate cleavage protein [Boseongicola sp.]